MIKQFSIAIAMASTLSLATATAAGWLDTRVIHPAGEASAPAPPAEPTPWILMLTSMLGMGVALRRRVRAVA